MAASLAEELKKDLGINLELVEGSGGIFDVKLDGKTIYSKKSTGRFPNSGEVSALLRKVKV